jgi:hypothetical protein
MKTDTSKHFKHTPRQQDIASAEDAVNDVMRGLYEIRQGLSTRTTAMDIFYETSLQ